MKVWLASGLVAKGFNDKVLALVHHYRHVCGEKDGHTLRDTHVQNWKVQIYN